MSVKFHISSLLGILNFKNDSKTNLVTPCGIGALKCNVSLGKNAKDLRVKSM